MKPFFALAAVAVLSISGCATQITPQIEIGPSPVMSPPSNADISPKSTRRDFILDRNFVLLQLDVSGGFAGIKDTMIIRRNSITATNPSRDPKLPTRTVAFTDAERKQLLQLLNDIRFAKLVGTYTQEKLRDGFGETVVLTTTNYGKTDTYIINNYGDRAPKDFYRLKAFLNDLQNQKFPAPRPRD